MVYSRITGALLSNQQRQDLTYGERKRSPHARTTARAREARAALSPARLDVDHNTVHIAQRDVGHSVVLQGVGDVVESNRALGRRCIEWRDGRGHDGAAVTSAIVYIERGVRDVRWPVDLKKKEAK